MLVAQYYLTDPEGSIRLQALTDLSFDEIEQVVGRFRSTHYRWPGLLRGQVYEYMNGNVEIRHHFHKNKKLWSSDCNE